MSQLKFCSRRSPVVCTSGCVASSQPLATNIGLDILKSGGNAVDAAVAVAAALNVTEPCSTGVGGDCFCLYYDAKTKQVYGLNGSGHSPQSLTLGLLKEHGFDEANPPPPLHAYNVTVPGAVAGWCDAVELFGSKNLSMGQILQPAIELAEKGFPVSEITSYHWKHNAHVLQAAGNPHGKDLLIDDQAPEHGQVFHNPFLADTFKELSATQLKLQPGEGVKVKGTVLPDAKGFAVNVGADCENLVLHFNPRFDCNGDVNIVVLNSKQDGEWGEERRESDFCFLQGEKTELTISFSASELKVKLPDGQEFAFPNRMGLETIQYLSVEGDFKIKTLKFLQSCSGDE